MATLAALDGGSGAASAQHCAAAPSAGSVRSAAFVRRASPVGREGGRCRHAATPPHVSATTSTRGKRPRWNSCCSTTRWISAPLPRPVHQPGVDNSTTTTTVTPVTRDSRGTLRHEDTPTPGDSSNSPQRHPQALAPPTQTAQQAAAWSLVAAQHDIARRDRVIDTMRARWWRQLYSYAIHLTTAQAQQRQLRALRYAHKETQQLAAQEQQLQKAATAAEITPTLCGDFTNPGPQQLSLASSNLAAAQTAALILVAAQQDISRRDRMIDAVRHRWWQQLCSYHGATVQRRRLLALHCAHSKAQQLAIQELQLEGTGMAKTLERLQRQISDQAMELMRLRNRPVLAAPQGSKPSSHDDLSYIG